MLNGPELRQLTDGEGRFTFPEIPPGQYPITISHLAYGSHMDSIRVDPGVVLRRLPLGDIESVEFLQPTEAGVRCGTGAATGVLVIHPRGKGPYRQ